MGIVFCQPSGRLNKCHMAKNGQLALLFQFFFAAICQRALPKYSTEIRNWKSENYSSPPKSKKKTEPIQRVENPVKHPHDPMSVVLNCVANKRGPWKFVQATDSVYKSGDKRKITRNHLQKAKKI